ncbi:MFS transporter [Nonomuraea sp. NPDC055795]
MRSPYWKGCTRILVQLLSSTVQPLRKNLRFQLFWLGSAASGLGSTLTLLAYPLLVLALTGSPGQAGLISAVSLASGMLFALPAGVLVDRWDRRRVLLGADRPTSTRAGDCFGVSA